MCSKFLIKILLKSNTDTLMSIHRDICIGGEMMAENEKKKLLLQTYGATEICERILQASYTSLAAALSENWDMCLDDDDILSLAKFFRTQQLRIRRSQQIYLEVLKGCCYHGLDENESTDAVSSDWEEPVYHKQTPKFIDDSDTDSSA